MDISVSRLNNRMVLQVPPELPLGLVFVVGQVHNLGGSSENAQPIQFDLVESGYRLRCQLSKRVANDIFLQEGDTVRAGGHLAFDTQAARYFLLARDLEIVPEITPGSRTKMASILQDVKKRAEAADLVRTELPQWVKQLAPPEVQEELGLIEEQQQIEEMQSPAGPEIMESETDLLEPVVDMSEEMLAFLSEAIDRNEDVEITPEVLAQFLPLERHLDETEREPAPPLPTFPQLTDTGDNQVVTPRPAVQEPVSPPPQVPEAVPALSVETAPQIASEPAAPSVSPPETASQSVPQPVQKSVQPAPKRSSNNIQTLLLVVIGILLFILVVVISLIALTYLEII